MLSLDDPRWPSLYGALRTPYDASRALRELEQGADAWEELWDGLHHQGDVDEASYAAVPQLVRWVQVLALALQDLRLATGPHDVQALLAALALARGQRRLGALLVHTETSELDALLEEKLAWSVLYRG